ncbi:MAG: phenylacetate-CoA oxygenase subunit PaaI [Candidatus Tectomicrobia bacterium]|nr:phenylacetate-CoA oxygenase subunit PaaI [Candidatus Tectomicrobia bacterium]
MSSAKISNRDDWVSVFRAWQRELNLDERFTRDFMPVAKYGEMKTEEIEFGDYKGRPKWRNARQVPDQRIRDSILAMITFQGDTEFASVEQQRQLLETAPSDADLKCLVRIMQEETRHGFQMTDVLLEHFGDSGKIEAQKLLERRATKNTRLLTTFNDPITTWFDLYLFQELVDRDGKFQLTMLSRSSFAPLARSMGPMLQEESFHLMTGHQGLTRVLKARRVPLRLFQKYLTKWASSAYDLFGTDHSGSAAWAYVWGVKGRYNEDTAKEAADKNALNEAARAAYVAEVQKLVDQLNEQVPEGEPKLRLPDLKFNRRIGDYAGKSYSVEGVELSKEAYQKHRREVLPTPGDEAELRGLMKDHDWVLGAAKA